MRLPLLLCALILAFLGCGNAPQPQGVGGMSAIPAPSSEDEGGYGQHNDGTALCGPSMELIVVGDAGIWVEIPALCGTHYVDRGDPPPDKEFTELDWYDDVEEGEGEL